MRRGLEGSSSDLDDRERARIADQLRTRGVCRTNAQVEAAIRDMSKEEIDVRLNRTTYLGGNIDAELEARGRVADEQHRRNQELDDEDWHVRAFYRRLGGGS